MKIGFDLDDTIINHSPHRDEMTRNGPLDKTALYGEISAHAPAHADALAVIEELSKLHDLYIISRRSPETREYARHWIETRLPFIPLDRVHFVITDHEKDLVCKRLGISLFMDDSRVVIGALTEAKGFLFDPHNTKSDAIFPRISSWQEAHAKITELTG